MSIKRINSVLLFIVRNMVHFSRSLYFVHLQLWTWRCDRACDLIKICPWEHKMLLVSQLHLQSQDQTGSWCTILALLKASTLADLHSASIFFFFNSQRTLTKTNLAYELLCTGFLLKFRMKLKIFLSYIVLDYFFLIHTIIIISTQKPSSIILSMSSVSRSQSVWLQLDVHQREKNNRTKWTHQY